ncbi:MAG: FtsX-like permease family protein [Thermoproteota archaeon]
MSLGGRVLLRTVLRRRLIPLSIIFLLCSTIVFNIAYQVEADGLQPFKNSEIANIINTDAIREHVKYLSSLRCRTPGYPGYEAAAKYIYENFVKNGLKPGPYGYFENFTVLVPVVHESRVQVLSPIQFTLDNVLTMYPMGLNPGMTPPEGIEGRLVYVGKASLSELEGKNLNDKIVLVDYENSGNWIRTVMFGAKAVLFIEPEIYNNVQSSLNGRLPDAPRLAFRGGVNYLGVPLNIPRLVVSRRDAENLIALQTIGEVKVRIMLNASWEEKPAWNILGVIPGRREEIVILSAYYDSQSYIVGVAPGADEAIGIAMIMELASWFKDNPPERTIWFLAIGSHYGGLKGSREFVEQHFEEIGNKISIWVNFDLASDVSDLGVFFCGYNYYFEASLLRYTWLRDRLFGSQSEVKNILQNLGLDINVEDGLRVREWRVYLPTNLAFDHEPYVLAGGVGITVATANSFRAFCSTPSDIYENSLGSQRRFENTKKQVMFAAALASSLINGPDFGSRGIGPTRYALQPNAGGFVTLTGKIVTYNYAKGWFEGVPHALVSVRLSYTEGGYSPHFYSLCKTDENGVFMVHGLPSETTYTGAQQLGVGVAEVAVPKVMVEAFVFNENGNVIYAPELWQQRSDVYPISFQVDSGRIGTPDAPRYFPVFPCGSIVLFNLIPPVNMLGSISILDSRGHTPPTSYGYVRDSFIEGEDITMIFAPEDVPIEVIIYSPGIPSPQGVLKSITEETLEGRGFSVKQGETLIILATPLRLVNDFHLLNKYRLHLASSYLAASAPALEFSKNTGNLLSEALRCFSTEAGFNYSRMVYATYAAWQSEINAYTFTRGLIFEIISSTLFFFILLVPFSILLVELVFSPRSGMRRILYACGVFALFTFLLYWFHPGFHLATNIYIMLVGIAILVFVTPIVGILWGRISGFIRAFREEVIGKHFAEISRFGAILIAFSMGVSNMRKRRLRTALTLVTITLIVFSLISLTSIYLISIVRTIPKPGKTYYDGILISEFRYLPSYLEAFLKVEIGDEAVICPRSWIYTSSGYVSVLGGQVPGTKIRVTRITDNLPRTQYVFSALLAVVPEDPIFEQGITLPNCSQLLSSYTAIIPREAADTCGWRIGDTIYVGEANLTIIGIFDSSTLNSLVDLNLHEVTPINWGVQWAGGIQHIPAQSVLIVPYSLAERLGYPPMQIVAKFRNQSRVFEIAQSLSNRLPFVVYASAGGQRANFQQQAWFSLRGIEHLVFPIIIAALAILDAMLANVYERVREIGIFSSLGLSPLHVAGLFLSETLVYSVVAAVLGYVVGLVGTNLLYMFQLMPKDFYPNFSSTIVILTVSISILTTIASSIYPVLKASRLVTPSVERVWKLKTKPQGDVWDIPLPFTSSTEETDGIIMFLVEFFKAFTTAEVGAFRTDNLALSERVEDGAVEKIIIVDTTLPPFDMGISQRAEILIRKDAGETNFKYALRLNRKSGTLYMWQKAGYRFVDSLRKQLLIWRTLPAADKLEAIEKAREMLEKFKEAGNHE